MEVAAEGNLFTAKPEPLADLLSDIHKQKVALPEFQRPWVWEPNMVWDLIVSVAHRYPAGSLLTMPVTGAVFQLRAFEGAGELKARPNLMILDGQQRLTSLYQALYRRDGVQYKGNTYHFFLDVEMLMTKPNGAESDLFESALFYVKQEKDGRRFRYEGLQPKYELTTPQHEVAAGAFPLGCILDAAGSLDRWRQEYLLQRSTSEIASFIKRSSEWDHTVKPWLDRIRAYPFPVVELRADLPLGAICHIFEKVNTTGVPLDVFDLCTAILWAQGFPLNKEWATTRKILEEKLPMQTKPFSGTYFLQGLSLLDSFDRKRSSPKRDVPVTCRKQDLMAMRAETVKRWWGVLVKGYEETAKFMAEQGVLAQRILPYSTLIVPLSAIFADLRHCKGDVGAGAAWPKIARWYWCCVFSQRYSSQIETASAQDFEQVLGWIDGGDPPEVVRTFVFRTDALQEITSIRNVIYKGVLCLLAKGGAKDFGGGGKLSTALFFDTQQDHHHIFPTDCLARLGISDPRADTIINKTLISAAVNRSIGGHCPSKYLDTWRTRLGQQVFDDILKSHLVDPEMLSSDNWPGYFLNRREELRRLVQTACGVTLPPFSDAGDVGVEAEGEEP